MSNQPRPFSWFRFAPFGRQLQPTLAPNPRPTAQGAPPPPPPQPYRPRPTIRPPAPAVTSPPPPPPTVAVPATALFPGVNTTTGTTTAQPASRPFTTYTAPASPVKSTPATTVPASPITKQASLPSSSPPSPTILPITSSSFNLSSPLTKTPTPSVTTYSPIPKPVASPPKSAASPALFPASTVTVAPTTAVVSAPTTAATTTTMSPRIIKTLKGSPPKYPETRPPFRPPSAPAQAATESEVPKGAPMEQEIKKQIVGREIAGNSKMKDKAAELKKLPRRLVTLVGENKGAIMVLNPSSTKKTYNGFRGKPQTIGNKEEGHNGEGGSKKKEEHDVNAMEMEPSRLFINSNVQGINNSILDDSSLSHHDPGFHLFFSTD